MDLVKLKEHVKYMETIEEFIRTALLISHNCKTFNQADSEIVVWANQTMNFLKEGIQERLGEQFNEIFDNGVPLIPKELRIEKKFYRDKSNVRGSCQEEEDLVMSDEPGECTHLFFTF